MKDEINKRRLIFRFRARMARAHPSAFMPHPFKGFTLVEILVVIAILSLLAAMLFPSFARSRASARRTSCVSNLKQTGVAFHLYRQDFDGGLPERLSLIHQPYLRDGRVLHCPNDAQRGQMAGNFYYEGNTYLPSGVSYEYFPQWQVAQSLNWYEPAPDFGEGKWEGLTPLSGCPWHWASSFSTTQSGPASGSRGWELILTHGGSVRKIRVEEPLAEFSPAKYR